MLETEKSYGLEAIHKELLIALDALDKICRENRIHYSLHGGTLLGAERNHKLIPWDDDIDVSMTRGDYEKLVKVLSRQNNGYYLNTNALWVPRFVCESRERTSEPVCIDIFVWDYISETKLGQKAKMTLLRALQGMLKSEPVFDGFSAKNKMLIAATYAFGKLFPRGFKLRLYKWIETNAFIGKRKYIHRSNDSFRGMSYVLDSGYMSGYTTLELEGKKYMVNKRYHEFLIMEYGENYLTPPPESERKPEHDSIRSKL